MHFKLGMGLLLIVKPSRWSKKMVKCWTMHSLNGVVQQKKNVDAQTEFQLRRRRMKAHTHAHSTGPPKLRLYTHSGYEIHTDLTDRTWFFSTKLTIIQFG